MLSELQKHIQSESLLPSGALVLIAVSGGADSIFLMHVLHRLQSRLDLRLHVVHLNHGLRGAESDADADFVVAQAAALGLADDSQVDMLSLRYNQVNLWTTP